MNRKLHTTIFFVAIGTSTLDYIFCPKKKRVA